MATGSGRVKPTTMHRLLTRPKSHTDLASIRQLIVGGELPMAKALALRDGDTLKSYRSATSVEVAAEAGSPQGDPR